MKGRQLKITITLPALLVLVGLQVALLVGKVSGLLAAWDWVWIVTPLWVPSTLLVALSLLLLAFVIEGEWER